jgi:SAM-dependent methyltransferase
MECPLCKSNHTNPIGQLENVCPVGNFIFSTKEDAQSLAKGKIDLLRCEDCSFTFNQAFDPNLIDYSKHEYNNSQNYSQAFLDHLSHVEYKLKSRFLLEDKTIVEVGCGDGTFLNKFKSNNTCFGFDPAMPNPAKTSGFELIKDFYHGDIEGVDLFISRHTFEHIPQPRGFAESILESNPENIYIEIPRLEYVFDTGEFCALTYEHCSWYAQSSIQTFLESLGYHVLEMEKQFGDEFLGIYATLQSNEKIEAESTYNTEAYKNAFDKVIAYYDEIDTSLESWKTDNKEVLMWGMGGKGASITSYVKHYDSIAYCIDSNPTKDEKFTPINGLNIYHPNTVKSRFERGDINVPDLVLITNSRYLKEIEASLADIFKQVITVKLI